MHRRCRMSKAGGPPQVQLVAISVFKDCGGKESTESVSQSGMDPMSIWMELFGLAACGYLAWAFWLMIRVAGEPPPWPKLPPTKWDRRLTVGYVWIMFLQFALGTAVLAVAVVLQLFGIDLLK